LGSARRLVGVHARRDIFGDLLIDVEPELANELALDRRPPEHSAQPRPPLTRPAHDRQLLRFARDQIDRG
jgi:hypothetical protein